MAAGGVPAQRGFAILGAAAFFVLAPGIVAGFVPWFITGWRFQPVPGAATLRPVGIAFILAGLAVILEAFARFALEGRGTPSPIYPTRRLVIGGSYRFVRNPMYLAIEAMILGQALLFAAGDLVLYAAIIGAGFHLFVVLVEEPALKRAYPKSYRRYADNVPRWLPRATPWRLP